MPGSLALASPSAVLPNSLSTSFTLSLVYPILSTHYQDGTVERSVITDGVNPIRALRTWRLSKRLTDSQLAALTAFWESIAVGGLNAFYFYDPHDVEPGQAIGSNYDAGGGGSVGRATVVFRGSWSFSVQLGRAVVPDLTLVEVA